MDYVNRLGNKLDFKKILILAAIFFFLLSTYVYSDIKLSSLFTDNMVLQQGINIPIWGKAAPGEKVTVVLREKQVSTVADSFGNWKVHLPPLQAGGPYIIGIKGNNNIKIKNVKIGEVWICSGQSNMVMKVKESLNARKEIAEAKYPDISLFTVEPVISGVPLNEVKGKWSICKPAIAAEFSGVGYFFARDIFKKIKTPIGIISSSWGGTDITQWMSRKLLNSNPEFKKKKDTLLKMRKSYLKKMAVYESELAQWKQKVKEAKLQGKEIPLEPTKPYASIELFRLPSGQYYGMIFPIIPYAIRGVIWFQGGSDRYEGYPYRNRFPAMIKSWRESWRQGNFPFLFVQLPNMKEWGKTLSPRVMPEVRESQLVTLYRTTNTAMAVTIDIGDGTAHAPNKQGVANRLALCALGMVYKKDVNYYSPLYKSKKNEGDKIRIFFSYIYKGLKTKNNLPLRGFEVAGENKIFFKAKAIVEKDTVLVWSDKVRNPVAVRYGWLDNPVCNLYNSEDLPASPFRTDNWKLITQK